MNAIIIHTQNGDYLICQPGSGVIYSERDVLDLLSNFYGNNLSGLVVYSTELHPDFFDLKSGLLGKIFLKLSTYQVKTAFIVDFSKIKSERFQELMSEHRRSYEIGFFESLADAEKWLFLR